MRTAKQIIDKRKELWREFPLIDADRKYRDAVVNYILEPTSKELRQEIKENPEYLIEMLFVVVDKEQRTVPFFFNDVQAAFLQDLKIDVADYKAGKRLHLKYLILKGRQQGFSQVISAYQLANAITQTNFSGITLADNTDNTNTLFEKKAKYQYSNLPASIQPTEKYNNRREFLFSNLNSSWAIDTAGNKEVGKSRTLNFFHGSECAFWPSISNIITGLGEALTKGSIQVLETTANGYNEFKDLWDGAGDGQPGDNTWQQKFYEWWRTSEYVQDYESPKAKKTFETKVKNQLGDSIEETKVLVKLHHLYITKGLKWDQLYWYYNKWKGYIDKAKIKQEYPCSPAEAFLSSGRCVFDQEVIIARLDELRQLYMSERPLKGEFRFSWHDPDHKDYILDDSIKFVENPEGCVTIYEDVKVGYPYVVGGDTKGEGKDFYASTCINNNTGKRAATIHATFNHSKPYTWQTYCLGRYFNNALIGIEMNFNTAPIEELERLHYPKQYVREVHDKIGHDYEKRYGWKTDGNTRPLIIDKEVEMVNEHPELFTDITMLNEGLTFIFDEDNRPDAEVGKHDDLLFSDMIANEIRPQQRFSVLTDPEPVKQKLTEQLGIKKKSAKWRTK